MDEWHEITKSATAAYLSAVAIIAREFECSGVSIRAFKKGTPNGKILGYMTIGMNDIQHRFSAVTGDKQSVSFMRVNFSGSTRPWELRVGDKAVRIANLSRERIIEGCERVKLGKR